MDSENTIKNIKKNAKRFLLVPAIIAIVILIIIMGSLYYKFRNDLKEFSKDSQKYYDNLKVTENGIESTSSTSQSAKQIITIKNSATVATARTYDRIASVEPNSIEKLANSNVVVDISNVSNIMDVTKSIIVATQSDYSTTKTISGKKGLSAQEVAKNISCLETYIKDSKDETKEEKLAYLLNAEAVTRFPYIESIANDDTKLNGIIKFYRYTKQIDNSSTIKEYQLSYITQEKFEEQFQNYQNSGDKEVLKHFTINDKQNVVIAGYDETVSTITTDDTEITADVINGISAETYAATSTAGTYQSVKYEAIKQEIEYKSLTEQYVLPFNFLATILIQTRDYDLAKELATLAYDSEVIIGIYDNEAVTVRDSTYTYSKLIEYTEYTDLSFSEAGININDSKYNGVIKYCHGEITTEESGQTTVKHFISPGYNGTKYSLKDGAIDGDLYTTYVDGLSTDGKISSTIKSNNNVFTTKHNIITTSNSTSTKGVILADVWAGKWKTTYVSKVDTIPADPNAQPVKQPDGEPKAIGKEKFSDAVYTSIIEPNLKAHTDEIKEEAINQIMEKEETAGTFNVGTAEMTAESIRTHAKNCEECKTILNDEYGVLWRIGTPLLSNEQLLEDVKVKEKLKVVNEHVLKDLAEEAKVEKQKKKEEFKNTLQNKISYLQEVVAQESNVNISCTEAYTKTTTTYEKDSTTTENIGEKFKKILNKSKYHETREALLVRNGWMWDAIQLNEDTAKLENVFRYLFNIALNTNEFGTFTEKDIENLFKAFEPNKIEDNLTGVGIGIGKYLAQFGGDATQYEFDGVYYYKMYNDTAGNPTIGIGDIQWLSNHGAFNVTGTVRYGGAGGTAYTDCNVEQKVNELLGLDGYKTKWEKTYVPQESETIYIDVETVEEVTDKMQSAIYNLVVEETSELNLSKQQLYALTYIRYSTGNLSVICGGEDYSIRKTFIEIYNEALSRGYEENSGEFNRYIWENWWCIKWAGGYSAGRTNSGWLKSRDAAFETYVKGTFNFEGKAGATREKNGYMFYSQENITMIGFSSSSVSAKYAKNRDISDLAAEQELFTYVEVSSMYPEGIRTFITAGHEYPEYPQSALVGSQYVLYKDRRYGKDDSTSTLGTSGCGTYSMACIVSGLLGDASVDPVTYVDNLDEYYPDGSYYVYNEGSNWRVWADGFLQKYYGLHSLSCYSESKMLEIFSERNGNCAAIGGEKGHLLAILPIIGDPDGYKFYVIDSARGHTGKYKSGADFINSTTATEFRVLGIIYP